MSQNRCLTSQELWRRMQPLARQMRAEPTEAEWVLWQELRNRRLGVRFRRQHCLAYYIVDFYCGEAGLVVRSMARTTTST